MIPSHLRDSNAETDAAVRRSVGGFFEEIGGRVVDANLEIPPNHAGVSFDSKWMQAPVVGLFDNLATPINAAHTLLILEPGPVDIHIRFPRDGSEPLGFLRTRTDPAPAPILTPAQLLECESPHTPSETLRDFLVKTKTQLVEEGFPVGQDFQGRIAAKTAGLVGEIVGRYYAQVDRGTPSDIKEICDLFRCDAEYVRGGKSLKGVDAISHFYRNVRSLVGSHEISSLSVAGLSVVVIGEFRGVSMSDQSPRVLGFSDHWVFELDGLVSRRTTYLSQGFEVTL